MKGFRIKLKFMLIAAISFSITQIGHAIEFEALKPAKLNIPSEIKKVFIDPKFINNTNDKLKIKNQAIRKLRDRLNKLDRFTVFLGPPKDYDPNREVVGIIQGDIISGGEIEEGQFTEKGECRGGISGIVGALTAKERSQQGITFSHRGILCKRPNLSSEIAETGISTGLGMLGIQEFPQLDEVIRIYKYKNISLFAQINLSFTQLGEERKTLAITADAASFSRHIVNPDTYVNVRESGDDASRIWLWFRLTPVAPVVIKKIGIVQDSIPASGLRKRYNRWIPNVKDIPDDERFQIISRVTNKTLTEFIKTISPYKIKTSLEIAVGKNKITNQLLQDLKFDEVKKLLKNADYHADLYNLGLAFEATAKTIMDYEDALFYYNQAFDQSPKEKLYALGIGRMEFQLKSAKKYKTQATLNRN